jgi:hypothetical protein
MAQFAITQSSIALPNGLALGQQSCIGSDGVISGASCDFSLNAAAPAVGSIATKCDQDSQK